jgi:hypothetical protein
MESIKGQSWQDDMYLYSMKFPFQKGIPKQQLVMREFKKMAIGLSSYKTLLFSQTTKWQGIC